MLNTFFFGYLSLKWKRLVRVISVFFMLIFPIMAAFFAEEVASPNDDEIKTILLLAFLSSFLIIGVISWVLQPFVVKED
ncbi:hypothetical protein OAO94_06510 [Flavobacteriaceae bacterium]|nr:hypothetical protein [Flavobacteriaceae bacterium]